MFQRDDDEGRGQEKTGCRRPSPVSTGQENNSCDLVTPLGTHKPETGAQICHGPRVVLFLLF